MIKKIFLASKSPRRMEILQDLLLDFELVESDYEEQNQRKIDVYELVKEHAIGKAKAAIKNIKGNDKGLVLGSDTIVMLDDKVLGKPEDRNDATEMLKLLSGKTQTVITAISLIDIETKVELTKTDSTAVTFINLDDQMISNYLDLGEYTDKAGSYAVQGHGKVFVKDIQGSFTNIVGLPSHLLLEMLKQF